MAPRLATISDDLSSDFADAARIAAELGLTGLAVRHVSGRNVAELDSDDVASIRRVADQHGLDISAVASPLGRGLSLDDDLVPALSLLDTMSRFAEILGTNLVRFFACWIPGKDAVQDWWERPDLAAALPRLSDRLGILVERAERSGVTLMLELEGASYIGQVAEAHALISSLNSPSLALCWDVCNGWWSGEHPVDSGLELAVRMPLADVQFKDVRAQAGDPTRPDLAQVGLGDGDIDYAAIISGLRRHDYRGWYTAERVYHPRKPEVERALQEAIIADLRQLRSLLT